MEDMLEMDLKGVVGCPFCGKVSFFVYSGAKGHASVPCTKCNRILWLIVRH